MTKDLSLAVVSGKVLTEQDVLSGIDTVLEKLYKTNDMSQATQVVNVMDKIGKVSGKAKAKLLWGMRGWYETTGQEQKRNDTFVDAIESDTETTPITTERYCMVWQAIEDCVIPVEVQNRRMDDLIKIATTLKQGYDIGKEEWKKLTKAANSSEVGEILRIIKGKPARKSGMQIELDRRGTLSVWKNNVKYFVGSLDIHSDNEVVEKAIQRIVDNSGIQKKG